MGPDLWPLYRQMKRSRLFEEAIAQLWKEGLISGEMHLGTGEEAIVAGILSHLRPGDALALDHRGTPPLLMRGVDPVLILKELLGRQDGLCKGKGGHMHLYSKENLAASSGIVGASGPAVAGFALAAQHLHPAAIAVAFFGEGAMNQGMLLESINLASAWQLPALFVCKDDDWAITTESCKLTGGTLRERVHGLGVPYVRVDGLDVEAVWTAARDAIGRARDNQGPAFIHARCVHLEGHFLGHPLLRATRDPWRELPRIAGPALRSFLRPRGAPLAHRFRGVRVVLSSLLVTLRDPRNSPANDPVQRTRLRLASDRTRLDTLEKDLEQEVARSVTAARQEPAP